MAENILITGASGFVGSHLVNHLKDKNQVICLIRDILPSLWLDEALDDVTLIHGDLRDAKLLKRVIGHYDITQVYHLAASAQVKHAHKNPVEVFESNVMGTVNILEACRLLGSADKKIVVLNTDKVYGEKLNAIETSRYEPSEPYATSKCCQGFAAQTFKKTYNMDIKMVHSVNIFGYDPFNSRLIPNVVKDCITGKKPVIFTNDNSIREYVYVDDAINALITVMNSTTLNHNIYHIHTGWAYNQKDVILAVAKIFGVECEYKEGNVPFQIQEETLSSINWNWKPVWAFEDALRATIRLFNEYREDWEKGG